MNRVFKILASKLPKRYQQELKRLHFQRQLKKKVFVSDEKEFSELQKWVSSGDWA